MYINTHTHRAFQNQIIWGQAAAEDLEEGQTWRKGCGGGCRQQRKGP